MLQLFLCIPLESAALEAEMPASCNSTGSTNENTQKSLKGEQCGGIFLLLQVPLPPLLDWSVLQYVSY